jgi:hypothetical protein
MLQNTIFIYDKKYIDSYEIYNYFTLNYISNYQLLDNDIWFCIFSFINDTNSEFLINICMVNKKFNNIINERIKPIYIESSRVCFRLMKGLNWEKSFEKLYSPALAGEYELALASLIKLKKIRFNESIKFIPKEIGLLTKLRTLDLFNNKIRVIPKEIGNLIYLQKLYLCNNKIKIIPDAIGKLTNLLDLNLVNNKIKIVPEEIGQLINLRKLYLAYNKIKIIPNEIKKLTNLEVLSLSFNKIEVISKEIKKLPNLQKLLLSHNKIKIMPKKIGKLKPSVLDDSFYVYKI